jgi:hypothetical protein
MITGLEVSNLLNLDWEICNFTLRIELCLKSDACGLTTDNDVNGRLLTFLMHIRPGTNDSDHIYASLYSVFGNGEDQPFKNG